MATLIHKTRVDGRPYKPWVLTRARKEAIEKARIVHEVLVAIGKKYRNREAHMFKVIPRTMRAQKRPK